MAASVVVPPGATSAGRAVTAAAEFALTNPVPPQPRAAPLPPEMRSEVLAKAEAEGKYLSQTLRELLTAGLGQVATDTDRLARLEQRDVGVLAQLVCCGQSRDT